MMEGEESPTLKRAETLHLHPLTKVKQNDRNEKLNIDRKVIF